MKISTAERLINQKIMPKQAKAIANEIENLEQRILTKCASKYMIENSFHKLNLSIDHKISNLKSELLKWFIGISLAQTASFISTLIGALH